MLVQLKQEPLPQFLIFDLFQDEGKPVPLKPGSCTFHSGGMLHHTEGNSTDRKRRAYITNFKPIGAVEEQSRLGIDYGMVEVSYFNAWIAYQYMHQDICEIVLF